MLLLPWVTDFDCRLGLAAWDAVSERPQLNSPRISRNSKTPFLPASHRAARKAPRAKPSRLRAVCRSVMVSAAESKPTSCVPGCAPARLALRLIGRPYPAPHLSSANLRNVPD